MVTYDSTTPLSDHRERIKRGIAAAKARGVRYEGRQAKFTEGEYTALCVLATSGLYSASAISRAWGIGRATFYRYTNGKRRISFRVKRTVRSAVRSKEKPVKDAAYAVAHHEEMRIYQRAWNKKHPEKMCEYKRKRRARQANAPINDFTAAQWGEMQAHYDHRCVYCGKRQKGKLTQEHLTPLSKGGPHTQSNIVPACRSCNSKKHRGPVLKPVQPLLL